MGMRTLLLAGALSLGGCAISGGDDLDLDGYVWPADCDNTSVVYGGAITAAGDDLTVTTTTISGNSPDAYHDVGGAYTWGKSASFTCDSSSCY